MQEDIRFMSLALEEARKGLGRTSPNPCVGAVLVRDGEIVGSGYHRRAGTPHAEVNAIHDAGGRADGATMYVTLEPCNHTGRTPPCTEAILQAGINRVVIGMTDPNPRVVGGGAAFLASRGVRVESGVLEHQCRKLVRPFLKHSSTGLPWVVMKAGMSLDGMISSEKGQGGRITGRESQLRVHTLRNELDAILIGVDTACIDDPSLTTRLPDNQGRDPLRIILDTHLRLSPVANMLRSSSGAETWIFCGPKAAEEKVQVLAEAGAAVYRVPLGDDGRLDLAAVLAVLGEKDVSSVLVEGGSRVHGSMLRQGLVDEVYLFIAPFFIGDGGTPLLTGCRLVAGAVGRLELTEMELELLGSDVLINGLVTKQ